MRCDEVMDWVDEAPIEELAMLPKDIHLHIENCSACAGYIRTSRKLAGISDEMPSKDLWDGFKQKLAARSRRRSIWASVGTGAIAVAASLMIAILPIVNNPADGITAKKKSANEYAQAVNRRSGDVLNIVNEAYKLDDTSDNQDDKEREALDYYYALADGI